MMQMKKGSNKLSALLHIKQTERDIRSLYFDLAAATYPGFLAALKETHPASKLMMGFGFPFMPEVAINPAVHSVNDFADFSDREKAEIQSENAQALFPRLVDAITLAKQGERSA